MIERVNHFMAKNGKPPSIVYIFPGKTDYVTYKQFQDMLQRYEKFRKEQGREPNYVRVLPVKALGYWLLKADVDKVDIENQDKVTDIILHETAFQKPNIQNFLNRAEKANIRIHAWMQCLHDKGGWKQPTTKVQNQILLRSQEIINTGCDGIHLDYIRYPGNAYEFPNATNIITGIVKRVYETVKSINPNILVSVALMPEKSVNAYYYGQDYAQLAQYLDVLIPMAYKGNYKATTDWITSIIQYVKEKGHTKVWAGLQSYHSDEDPTPLSPVKLQKDIDAANRGGADGIILFRYGLLDTKILRGKGHGS